MYHTDFTLVFRHEHANIAIQRGRGGICRKFFRIYAEPCISCHEVQENNKCSPLILSIIPPITLPMFSAPDSLSLSSVYTSLYGSYRYHDASFMGDVRLGFSLATSRALPKYLLLIQSSSVSS